MIFVGGGILNDEYVKNKFSKKREEQYLVIDQFYSYFKNNGLDRSNKYFEKLLTSKNLKICKTIGNCMFFKEFQDIFYLAI